KGSREDKDLGEVMEKIRQFGQYLGNEIVVCAEMDAQGSPTGPLVMAELRDPSGIRTFIEQQLDEFAGKNKKGGPSVRFVDDPLAPGTGTEKNDLFIWINGDTLIASPQLAELQKVASTPTSDFKSSSLYPRIAEIYQNGAGLLVAADLEKVLAHLEPNKS